MFQHICWKHFTFPVGLLWHLCWKGCLYVWVFCFLSLIYLIIPMSRPNFLHANRVSGQFSIISLGLRFLISTVNYRAYRICDAPCVCKTLWFLVLSAALSLRSSFLCWFYSLLVLRVLLMWGCAWIPSLCITLGSSFCLIISEEWAPLFDQNYYQAVQVSLVGMSCRQRHLP